MVVGNVLENGFEATLGSETNVVNVWKGHFSVFRKLLSDEVETIFWESKAKRSRLLKLKFGRGSFQENDIEAKLSGNTNVLSLWKEHLSVFCNFLSDEVETIFWKSYAKRSKLFKSKSGPRELLRKWFWRYLELKNECSESLKRVFLGVLELFVWRSWNHLLEKWRKAFKSL